MNLHHYFTHCMQLCIVFFFMIFIQTSAIGQNLVITENQTQQEAEQMIQDIFVGTGVQVFNVSYLGYPQASGSFAGNTGVGLDDGFLMTSGRAGIAQGPNDSQSSGHSNGAAGDPDLDQFSGGFSYDACVMHFDFIPFAKYITFKFVFGSEEYPEYAPPNNSSFNDKFGFFLSGPGIEGPYSNNSVNIATLPNSSTVVSINTVNAVTNQEYFVSNWNPVVNNNIQYDGYTTLIDIFAEVEPLETYHLKLAISDGGDRIFDSGLFFKAFSFRSTDIMNKTEIAEVKLTSRLLSPNPGNGRFSIDPGKFFAGNCIYELFNTNGTKLLSSSFENDRSFLLDMSGFPAGVYFVRISDSQRSETHKLVNR
jgi:hypothetical protein